MVVLSNLNHYRDFISTHYISKVIIFLMKKRAYGIINIGSGKKTHLKTIAIKIANKFKKNIEFNDNAKPTIMVSDISKLNKIGFPENIKFY